MARPTFDAESHRYTHPSRGELISVTTALRDAGIIDASHYTDFGRLRGTYVHQLLELADRDDLDEASVDPTLAPYLTAWRRFLAESGFRLALVRGEELGVEQPYCDPILGYAGTVDRIGALSDGLCVLDIKSGKPEPWHAVQLAAYVHLVCDELGATPRTVTRLGVYVTSDGAYVTRVYPQGDLGDDFATFKAALRVAQWRRFHARGKAVAA